MKKIILPLILLLTSTSGSAEEPTLSVKLMSTDIAQRIAVAAMAHCSGEKYLTAVVVVSRDGYPQAILRHALASPITLKIAKRKAFTAASMRTPSEEVGQPLVHGQRQLTNLRGGLPIEVGGVFYGGVGVSGATGDIDQDCAQAGIEAVSDDLEFSE